jgi:rRNA maturation endonuclease Nob1
MKAKMGRGQKPPEPGNYQCQKCNSRFQPNKDSLVCPQCGNAKAEELVPIYMEEDPEEEQMYSKDDFRGGD